MTQNDIYSDAFTTLIKKIRKLFIKHGIKYWLDEGTLLAAIRDKKLIDGDRDFDFAVEYTDLHKILLVCKTLQQYGYKIEIQKGLPYVEDLIQIYLHSNSDTSEIHVDINIYYIQNDIVIRRNLHYPIDKAGKYLILLSKILFKKNIDLYKTRNRKKMIFLFLIPYKYRVKMSYILMNLYLKISLTRCFILPKAYFTKLNEVYFLGEYFPIPGSYEKVLASRYGSNWITPIPPAKWNKIWKNEDKSINIKRLNSMVINHTHHV